MKTKKVLSIFFSLVLVFAIAFTNVSQAMEKSSSSSPAASIKSGNYMYYEKDGNIYKINVSTHKISLVKKINHLIWDITVKDGWIYCTVDKIGYGGCYDPYIYKVRTNGSDGKYLKRGYRPKIYSDKIYYIKVKGDPYSNLSTVGIYKMSLSGKSDTCVKKTSTVSDIAVYKSNIYYVNGSSKYYLRKTNLSGSTSKILTSTYNGIDTLRIYSDYIYFNSNNNIYKIKTTSTSKYRVLSNAELKEVNNGYIYYQISESMSSYPYMISSYLYRMNLSSKSKLYLDVANLFCDVSVSSGYMIYTYHDYLGNPPENNTFKCFCTTKGRDEVYLGGYYSEY